jgi:arabinofuranosyltransferase
MFLNRFLPRSERDRTLFLYVGAIALVILLIRTAWASEDAYISFRVVQNFLEGHGLNWNVGERVQAYTDPLFVFLLIAGTWLSGSVYWSSILISLALTVGVYFLLMSRMPASTIMIGTAILLSSKAFMDFSVSGMENPATHVGIAAFCWAYWRKREPLLLTLIASVTAVNRLDSLLLFLPALLVLYFKTGLKAWKAVLIGLMPLIVWEVFSLFYYGFPFPNTAYAKLGAGINSQELIHKGFLYLANSLAWDKVTSVVIALGFIVCIWFDEWSLAVGLLGYVAYVIRIGGDYMSGRFLSAPFILACAVLIWYTRLRWMPAVFLSAAFLASTFLNPHSTLTTTAWYGVDDSIDFLGIADERAYSYRATGLLRWRPNLRWPDAESTSTGDQFRRSGSRVVIFSFAGVTPYRAGSGVHVIDRGALADAFLARLPPKTHRRAGHYFRDLPPGYFETVATGKNQIQDPNLAQYYTHLHEIISGDLLSGRRFQEILAMNLGKYDSLLPKGLAGTPGLQ